jgi:hypothetical protein
VAQLRDVWPDKPESGWVRGTCSQAGTKRRVAGQARFFLRGLLHLILDIGAVPYATESSMFGSNPRIGQ